MGISNMTLVKIASIGGVLTVSMGLAFRWKVSSNVRKSEHYQEAFRIVRASQAAIQTLGEPIKDKMIDIGNTEKNYTHNLSAQYEVPVSGSKQRGTVYFWADRSNVSDPWRITRIELGLKSEPNKRLLIRNVVES